MILINKLKINLFVNCNLKDKSSKNIKDGFIEYWQINNTKDKNKVIKFNRSRYNKYNKGYLLEFNEYNLDTFLYLVVFARGLLNHLYTMVYLEDKIHLNKKFFIDLPKERRNSLVAKFVCKKNNIKYYKHDLFLCGLKETIFFEPILNISNVKRR